MGKTFREAITSNSHLMFKRFLNLYVYLYKVSNYVWYASILASYKTLLQGVYFPVHLEQILVSPPCPFLFNEEIHHVFYKAPVLITDFHLCLL